jgi:hypothetical protein
MELTLEELLAVLEDEVRLGVQELAPRLGDLLLEAQAGAALLHVGPIMPEGELLSASSQSGDDLLTRWSGSWPPGVPWTACHSLSAKAPFAETWSVSG